MPTAKGKARDIVAGKTPPAKEQEKPNPDIYDGRRRGRFPYNLRAHLDKVETWLDTVPEFPTIAAIKTFIKLGLDRDVAKAIVKEYNAALRPAVKQLSRETFKTVLAGHNVTLPKRQTPIDKAA